MIEEANKKLLGVSDLREAIRKRREGRNANGKYNISAYNFTSIAKNYEISNSELFHLQRNLELFFRY